jgi:LeuA allosteric (dimerisation) domain.
MNGNNHVLNGEGNGPIDAAMHALRNLDIGLQVRSYEERSMGGSAGSDAKACAFMEVSAPDSSHACYGAGTDGNIVTASIKALISGVNRLAALEAQKRQAGC